MKRILYSIIVVLFFAFSFSSNPPGWYVQILPVNKNITDIFFRDSLYGWVVTEWAPQFDTGYILGTTNGGEKWNLQFRGHLNFNVLSFPSDSVGYAGGGDGFPKLYRTTNGGINWILTNPPPVHLVKDAYFVNNDTGWICDDDPLFGGLYKTTNGSVSWIHQLDVSYKIQKIFFLNKDTGWAGSNEVNGKLYRTTNGGVNWNLLYSFIGALQALFFINPQKGWISGAFGKNNHTIQYTTSGGSEWEYAKGEVGGFDLKFTDDSIGYAGGGSQPLRIIKSTNGGRYWGFQSAQTSPDISVAVLKGDSLRAWAGKQALIHTTDGGGILVNISDNENKLPEKFTLHQNYPNPFNPTTKISYELQSQSNVSLIIYDISGRIIKELVNQNQLHGEYSYTFDGADISSGVYFYKLSTEKFTETKKMILAK